MKMSGQSAVEKMEMGEAGTGPPSITASKLPPPAELSLLPQFNSPSGTLVGSPLTDGIMTIFCDFDTCI